MSLILQISGIANLEHQIYFSFIDNLLVFLEKGKVINFFQKKCSGGISVSPNPENTVHGLPRLDKSLCIQFREQQEMYRKKR